MTTGDPSVRDVWGPIANAWMVVAEQAIMGNTAISLAGLLVYSLTVANNASDQSRLPIWNFTGALAGNCTVTAPGIARVGSATNNTTGGFNVILTTGGGTTLTLEPGFTYDWTCDGTNFAAFVPHFPSAGFASEVSVGTPTVGTARLNPGDATHPGYVAFHNAAGARVGFAGFSDGGTKLVLDAENGFTGWKVLDQLTVALVTTIGPGTNSTIAFDPNSNGVSVSSLNPPAAPFTCFTANVAAASSVPAAWQFGGADIGSITVTGGGTGVAYNTTSDATLKDHDRFIEGDGAVAIVQGLQPRWFRWKANPEGEPEPGFFAQQVAEFFPWAVTEATEAIEATETTPAVAAKPWQMDNAKLLPVVVAALQHALARIEALERREP